MTDGNIFLQAKGLGNMSRIEQTGSTNMPLGIGGMSNGAARTPGGGILRNTIDRLLGGDITLNPTRAVDLDRTYASAPQAAMGLTVGVSGRATIVNADVASHLSEFQDPIKALLGVALHRDHRVIIKRRYVQGGEAQVIPERAPGRTVSVRTEEREVVLARYGGDIEMSTNLMAGEPEMAAADLNLKMNFQKSQLDKKLVELGYQAIMTTATDSARALLESLPNRNSMSGVQATMELENLRARVFFGAFEKFEQPLMNLLAASKRGAVMNADPFDTIIVPAGLPDLHQFSRGEARHYYLNGTPDSELDGVKFALTGGLYDTPSGLTCYVTHPKVNYAAGGTLRPRMQESPMYRKRTIAMFYQVPTGGAELMEIMNYESGEWESAKATMNNDRVYVRYLTLMMSSAIIGRGGSDTGELIVAYPMTSVHTVETSPEYMKMQLRCHMGAAVYKPENIQVLPDVHIEGFIAQSNLAESATAATSESIKLIGTTGTKTPAGTQKIEAPGGVTGISEPDKPVIAYRGAMRWKKLSADPEWNHISNNGHLGDLDCPRGASRIRGHNVFSRQAVPVTMTPC